MLILLQVCSPEVTASLQKIALASHNLPNQKWQVSPARLTGRFGSQLCGNCWPPPKNRMDPGCGWWNASSLGCEAEGASRAGQMKMHQDRPKKNTGIFDAPKNVKGLVLGHLAFWQFFLKVSVFKDVLFSPPNSGEMIQFDRRFFQTGGKKPTKWWFWCPKNVTCLGRMFVHQKI